MITGEQALAWIKAHFPDHRLRKNNTEVEIVNPFNGSMNKNFGISLTKLRCHCWTGDEWAGPARRSTVTGRLSRDVSFVHFVQVYLGCSRREAIQAIQTSMSETPSLQSLAAAMSAVSNGRPQLSEFKEEPLVALPPSSERLLESSQPQIAAIVLRHLASRGVDTTAVQRYDIHHAGMEIVWPYYEYEVLVYWQSRHVMNKRFNFPSEEKYGVGKGQFLYNWDQVEPAENAIITESIFCCHTLVDQCLASGGADLLPAQAHKLRLLGPRRGVVLAPDNDAAGIRSVVHNAALLQAYGFKVYYSLPPYLKYVNADGREQAIKDWNELYVHLGMSLRDIQRLMVAETKPFTITAKVKLMKQAAAWEQRRAVPLLP